ncbi:MAG: hypothetical protein BWY82_01428 [Verrucomicrobia bacterium ADurb.Bin474]|nr:MAG: hypothetical protein BWY82_01428 [Verrucomicrobia bacterium ADurb.Bin474]
MLKHRTRCRKSVHHRLRQLGILTGLRLLHLPLQLGQYHVFESGGIVIIKALSRQLGQVTRHTLKGFHCQAGLSHQGHLIQTE